MTISTVLTSVYNEKDIEVARVYYHIDRHFPWLKVNWAVERR